MKSPVVLVTAALTVAILLAASFLIATGTRGENAFWLRSDNPAGQMSSPGIARP
jgi:aldose sugar dehydrogenase